ncbi:MAG TPA: quinol:electron acceptor oxidoreductase subunit ActD, partial [Gemmatimonadaceae bacterium]
IGSLATVAGLFVNARIPRITMTVGYNPRFSDGNFGLWVETPPERQNEVSDLLRRVGALEVRSER